MKYTSIGGQAVMEGVMMRSANSMVMSVRRADGTICVEKQKLERKPWRKKIAKIPFVRGIFSFVDSLVQGMKLTTRSAEMYGEDAVADLEPSKFEKWLSEKLGLKVENVAIVIGVLLGLVLSVALFIILPQFVVGFLDDFIESRLVLDIIEGIIKIVIFVAYILAVSLTKDIKRLFMYHGAEHKVISCYEHGEELTVENAKKYSTSHPRCGTSFIFIIMVVGILMTAVADNLFGLSRETLGESVVRVVVKLGMLPVIAGVAFEILKGLAVNDNLVLRILRSPGMLLQKLTTRQPDDSMLEVSLTSFKNVLYMDGLMEEPKVEAEENTANEATNDETVNEDGKALNEDAEACRCVCPELAEDKE